MSDWTRRAFVGVTAMAGGALATKGSARGKAERLAVNFTGDGLELSPAAYAALLARLAQGGVESDEYSRGGAVEALESQFARLLGKEAAVFMPSGTLANHLAVRTLAGSRRRVLVQDVSHLYNDSGDCAQTLSALNLVALAPGKATFTWEEAERAIERGASGRVPAPVGAISSSRRCGASTARPSTFQSGSESRAQARQRGIGLHLDGARLFVQCAYFGRAPSQHAALFDTVYVSLWKCFNSGGGAILAGPRLSSRTCPGPPDVWRRALERVAVRRGRAPLRRGLSRRLAAAVSVARELIAGFVTLPKRFSSSACPTDEPVSPRTPHARSPRPFARIWRRAGSCFRRRTERVLAQGQRTRCGPDVRASGSGFTLGSRCRTRSLSMAAAESAPRLRSRRPGGRAQSPDRGRSGPPRLGHGATRPLVGRARRSRPSRASSCASRRRARCGRARAARRWRSGCCGRARSGKVERAREAAGPDSVDRAGARPRRRLRPRSDARGRRARLTFGPGHGDRHLAGRGPLRQPPRGDARERAARGRGRPRRGPDRRHAQDPVSRRRVRRRRLLAGDPQHLRRGRARPGDRRDRPCPRPGRPRAPPGHPPHPRLRLRARRERRHGGAAARTRP